MKTTIISFLCLLLFAAAALAGGSFNLSDVRDLLQQQSKRWGEIRKEYDIEETGDALRFGRQWKHLGGARCGPYELKARKKGSSGGYTHKIVINTQATFYDKQGKKVADSVDDAPFDAYRVKEIVKSIQVPPL
jgi:hypothetical protein